MTGDLLLRNVEVDGRAGLDVRLAGGRIAEIGQGLTRSGETVDGRGGALVPGLCDHHIHLLGLAAQADSVDVSAVADAATFSARIAAALSARPKGAWVRITGYHERIAGELSRHELDVLAPNHRIRLQHQTGALWVLNSAALEAVADADAPPCLERGADGAPTGRIWRGDAWLRSRIGRLPPPLAPVGAALAAWGVTALTDASVTTDAGAAQLLADAVRDGALPQRLMLMSGGELTAPADGAFRVGPLKILLDDHSLPPLDDFIARIGLARAWGRAVAVHCVTAGELALTLAAFDAAGSRAGDRIEHGGVIPFDAISQIRTLSLTVVTQPAFVHERGDRYLSEVDPAEQADLYRCASLLDAGVPVAGSSDAPYASANPWDGIATAVRRTTRAGQAIGEVERIDPARALGLYLDDQARPGCNRRRVVVGGAADLCLLKGSLEAALDEPGAVEVALTLMEGVPINRAASR